MSKEIHLKNRPSGYADIEDFEIVEVEIPEVKKKGSF
jgi:NADPH-dependent curcumin reductase CurA